MQCVVVKATALTEGGCIAIAPVPARVLFWPVKQTALIRQYSGEGQQVLPKTAAWRLPRCQPACRPGRSGARARPPPRRLRPPPRRRGQRWLRQSPERRTPSGLQPACPLPCCTRSGLPTSQAPPPAQQAAQSSNILDSPVCTAARSIVYRQKPHRQSCCHLPPATHSGGLNYAGCK